MIFFKEEPIGKHSIFKIPGRFYNNHYQIWNGKKWINVKTK